jgi:DNA-binding transcriptional ArsR family regulator
MVRKKRKVPRTKFEKIIEFIKDPLYLKLLVYIASRKANYVQALARKFKKSIGTIGKQLTLLYELNLLRKVRKGKKVIYDINWKELLRLVLADWYGIICTYIMDERKIKEILEIINSAENDPDVIEIFKSIFCHYSKEYIKYKGVTKDYPEMENVHKFATNLWVTIRFLFYSRRITENMIKNKNLLNLFKVLNDPQIDILWIYENSIMHSLGASAENLNEVEKLRGS